MIGRVEGIICNSVFGGAMVGYFCGRFNQNWLGWWRPIIIEMVHLCID